MLEQLRAVRDEEDTRHASERRANSVDVERREQRLAETGRHDDEAALASVGARRGERVKCGLLDLVRLRLRRWSLGLDLAGGKCAWRAPHTLRVGLDPVRRERARAAPPVLEGVDDLCVRCRITLAVDAKVPLDAGAECGRGDVAAPDEGGCETVALEAPRLRVERDDALVVIPDLDDPCLEAAAWSSCELVRCCACGGVHALRGIVAARLERFRRALPVEQTVERARLGDVEVVPCHDADPSAAPERVRHQVLEPREPAVLDERGDDRDVVRAREQRPQVAEERVV